MIRRASGVTFSRCRRQHNQLSSGGMKLTFVRNNLYGSPIGSLGYAYDVSSTCKLLSTIQLNKSSESIGNSIKPFSTVAATSTSSTTSSSSSTQTGSSASTNQQQSSNDKDGNNKSKKDDSNIFLDNLGKIFLSTIGLVLFMLLRSTKSNNARTALRGDIETNALLDPLEIDDLRLANSDFTIDIWENIVKDIRKEFPNRTAVTYPEFLTVVMRVMREAKGEGFTIQFGHLVDRVVIAELERTEKNSGGGGVDFGEGSTGQHQDAKLLQVELPLAFLFAALSLALHSTVTDRVRALFEAMVLDGVDTPSVQQQAEQEEHLSADADQISQMIQYLQNTCQLVPEAQIVETNSKVPYQTFRVGTGEELTMRARQGFGGKKGSAGVTKEVDGPVTLDDFHAILKSRAVCAWGECYVKKRGRTSTSDR